MGKGCAIAAGDPEQIAKDGKVCSRQLGHLQEGVNVGCRGDTDRTTGAGDELNFRRQQVAQTATEDGHGVGAAHLHDPERSGGGRSQLVEQMGSQLRVAEFVNIFHELFVVAQAEVVILLEKNQSKTGTLFI